MHITNAAARVAQFCAGGEGVDAGAAEERARVLKRREVARKVREREGEEAEEAEVRLRRRWGEKVLARVLACTSVAVDGFSLDFVDARSVLSPGPLRAMLVVRSLRVNASDTSSSQDFSRLQKGISARGCALVMKDVNVDGDEEVEGGGDEDRFLEKGEAEEGGDVGDRMLVCEGIEGRVEAGGGSGVKLNATFASVKVRGICQEKLAFLESAARSIAQFHQFVRQGAFRRSFRATPQGERMRHVARHVLRTRSRLRRLNALPPSTFALLQATYLAALRRRRQGRLSSVLVQWLDDFELYCPSSVLVELCQRNRSNGNGVRPTEEQNEREEREDDVSGSGWRDWAYAVLIQEERTALREAHPTPILAPKAALMEASLHFTDIQVQLPSSSQLILSCSCQLGEQVQVDITHFTLETAAKEPIVAIMPSVAEEEEEFFDAAEEIEEGEDVDVDDDERPPLQTDQIFANVDVDAPNRTVRLRLRLCDIMLSAGRFVETFRAWQLPAYVSSSSLPEWQLRLEAEGLMLGLADASRTTTRLIRVSELRFTRSDGLVLEKVEGFIRNPSAASRCWFNAESFPARSLLKLENVAIGQRKGGRLFVKSEKSLILPWDAATISFMRRQVADLAKMLQDLPDTAGPSLEATVDLAILRIADVDFTEVRAVVTADGIVTVSSCGLSGRARSLAPYDNDGLSDPKSAISIKFASNVLEVTCHVAIEVDLWDDFLLPEVEGTSEASLIIRCPLLRIRSPSTGVEVELDKVDLQKKPVVEDALDCKIQRVKIVDKWSRAAVAYIQGLTITDHLYKIDEASVNHPNAVGLLHALQPTLAGLESTSFLVLLKQLHVDLPTLTLHSADASLEAQERDGHCSYTLLLPSPNLSLRVHGWLCSHETGSVRVLVEPFTQVFDIYMPIIQIEAGNDLSAEFDAAESFLPLIPNFNISLRCDEAAVLWRRQAYRAKIQECTLTLAVENGAHEVLLDAAKVAIEIRDDGETWGDSIADARGLLRASIKDIDGAGMLLQEVDVNLDYIHLKLPERLSTLDINKEEARVEALNKMFAETTVNLEVNGGELRVDLDDTTSAIVQFAAHGSATVHAAAVLSPSIALSFSLALNKALHQIPATRKHVQGLSSSGVNFDASPRNHDLSDGEDLNQLEVKRVEEVLIDWSELNVEGKYYMDLSGGVNDLSIAMRSDIRLQSTYEDLQLLHRAASSFLSITPTPQQPHSTSDPEHYVVHFTESTLGLKLGPSQSEPLPLEVRGYSKGCPEYITRRVMIGDRLSEVNSTPLAHLSPAAAVGAIRDAGRPAAITFSRPHSRSSVLLASPEQYLPVDAEAYVCEFCGAVVGLAHGEEPGEEKWKCAHCGGEQVRPEAGEEAWLDVVEEESFENQRFYRLHGWSQDVLPADGYPWSDRLRRRSRPLSSFSLPPTSSGRRWTWLEEWKLDRSRGDKDAWVYGADFDRLSSHVAGKAFAVRQRRWTRRRGLVNRPAAPAVDRLRQRAVFTTGRFRLAVIVCAADDVAAPLCRCSLGGSTVRVAVWSRSRRCTGSVRVAADVRNGAVAAWEPIVEPWELAFEYSQDGVSATATLLGVDSLSLNFSSDVILAVEHFSRALRGEASAEEIVPVVVVNSSGSILSVWREADPQHSFELQPNDRVALNDLVESGSFDGTVTALGVELFGGWKPLRHLPINAQRTWAIALSGRVARQGSKPVVFVQVFRHQMQRQIAILAPVSLRNFTAAAIRCIVRTKTGRTILIGPIEPEQSAPIPFDVTDADTLSVSWAESQPQGSMKLCEVDLPGLVAQVQEWTSVHLKARRGEYNSVVEQQHFEAALSKAEVVTSVHVRAVERCHTVEQMLPMVNDLHLKMRRSFVGQPFSAQMLTLSFHAPLKFSNNLSFDLELHVQMDKQELRIPILPGETWPMISKQTSPNLRYRIRCPALSAIWSDWKALSMRSTQLSLHDSQHRRITVSCSCLTAHESRVNSVTFSCGLWAKNSTTFPLEIAVVRNQLQHEASSSHVEQIPSLFHARTEEVQESERWTPLGGWAAPSLPHDPPQWALQGGLPRAAGEVKSLDAVQTEEGWKFADKAWRLGRDWTYAVDFNAADWAAEQRSFHCVRKRLWKRAVHRTARDPSDLTPIGDDIAGLKLRVGGGEWSENVEVGVDVDVDVRLETAAVTVHVEWRRDCAPYLPMVAVVRPRFAVANETKMSLIVEQWGGQEHQSVVPAQGNVSCWIWPAASKERLLRIGKDGLWSGPLDLRLVESLPVALRDAQGNVKAVARVSIEEQPLSGAASSRIVISDEEYPGGVVVENRTSAEVVVAHKTHPRWELKNEALLVKGMRVLPFGWDCVVGDSPPNIVIGLTNGEFLTVNMDYRAQGLVASSKTLEVIVYTTRAAGRVICIISKDKLLRGMRRIEEKAVLNVRVELPHLCISLVDSAPVREEQLVLHLGNVQFHRRLGQVVDDLALTMEAIQLDDTVKNTRWPVVLKIGSDSSSSESCAAEIVAERLLRKGSRLGFRSMSILIRPAVVQITRHLFKYLQVFSIRLYSMLSTLESKCGVSVDALHIQPICLTLTLSSSVVGRTDHSSEGVSHDTFERQSAEPSVQSVAESAMLRVTVGEDLPYWASALEHLLGTDVVGREMKLPSAFALNLNSEDTASLESIYKHYREAFVSELTLAPLALKSGELAKSFMTMQSTVHSISETSETITKGLARALTTISFSNEYLAKRQQTEESEVVRFNSVHESVRHGASKLSEGIGDAVKGIVLDPYRGAQDGGAVGFVEGIGKGVLGVAVKPAVGVLDLASNTAKGLKNAARPTRSSTRSALFSIYKEAANILQTHDGQDTLVRPTRVLYGYSRKLQTYSLADSFLLGFLNQHGFLNAHEAFYMGFPSIFDPGDGEDEDSSQHVHVLTSANLLVFRRNREDKWLLAEKAVEQISLKSVQSCSVQRTATGSVGVRVEHSAEGATKKHTFLPCRESEEAKLVFKLLHDILQY